jgi:hypothetical protein
LLAGPTEGSPSTLVEDLDQNISSGGAETVVFVERGRKPDVGRIV